jgi:glycerate kinase
MNYEMNAQIKWSMKIVCLINLRIPLRIKVASHIRKGIKKSLPEAECKESPWRMGEEHWSPYCRKQRQNWKDQVFDHDAIYRIIYGISGDGKTAFVEMAAASGMAS